MRKRSHQEARPPARSSRQQELPFAANILPALKDADGLLADRPSVRRLLAAVLECSRDAVLTVSRDGKIGTWSAGAERLYGYTADEITGQPLSRLMPVYESPRLESVLSPGGEQARLVELGERLHKNGSKIRPLIRRSLIYGDRGEVEGILEMAEALDSHAALLSPAEAPLRLLMEQLPGLLWTTDRHLRILTHGGSGLPAAKMQKASLQGRDVREFFGVADAHQTPIAEHHASLGGVSSQFEYSWRGRVLEIRVRPLRTSAREIMGCLGTAVDVTDRKKSQDEALYQARHDGLTGLANYREFMGRLEDEVRRAERGHHRFALLLLDLDELKRINDLHGHLAGDGALRRLAAVMNEHCRSTDVAARYGGDEFAVLLIDSDRGMAEHVAERIALRLRSDEQRPQLSVSIGIGVYPDDGRTAARIMAAADERLYRHKRNPRVLSADGAI